MKLNCLGLADKIKAHWKANGCSLDEAKRVVEREHLLRSIDECQTFYELKQLVRAIAERTL